METETIPVVIGALGVIKKGLEKYVDRIPGTTGISKLQKITLLGTNSPHPQKGPVNQVNSLVPKVHGLDSVLLRLNNQAKDYNNSMIIIMMMMMMMMIYTV